MEERRFNVLMYGNIIVDEMLLSKGIYEAEVPKLHAFNTSIESMVVAANMMRDINGNGFIPNSYFDNLIKCKFVSVSITLDI